MRSIENTLRSSGSTVCAGGSHWISLFILCSRRIRACLVCLMRTVLCFNNPRTNFAGMPLKTLHDTPSSIPVSLQPWALRSSSFFPFGIVVERISVRGRSLVETLSHVFPFWFVRRTNRAKRAHQGQVHVPHFSSGCGAVLRGHLGETGKRCRPS